MNLIYLFLMAIPTVFTVPLESNYFRAATGPHPLDPLSAAEIKLASKIIESSRPSQYLYNYITLDEPPKKLLLPFFLNDTDPPFNICPRRAKIIISEIKAGAVYEAIVNLNSSQIETLIKIDYSSEPIRVQNIYGPDILQDICIANASVRKRSADLGFPDMSLVYADPWTMGYIGDKPHYLGKTLLQMALYGKNHPKDNGFGHPFDFLAIVDPYKKEVVAIEDLPTHDDFDGSNKKDNVSPKRESNYDYELRGGESFLRKEDKPIKIISPEGPSFTIEGHLVQWQKWKIRVGYNGREGLVLYNINYNDNGTVRPVIYRASLTELWVPYGDPRSPYYRRSAFDMVDSGLGFLASPQFSNEDVLGAHAFFDLVLNDRLGLPYVSKNAISVREEDSGILWKHVDYRTGKGVVTRSHRLVFSIIYSGVYDYNFQWIFYQDGSIQYEIQLTGILTIALRAPTASPRLFGSTVAPQINGLYHQHLFTVRMDVDIDGVNNSVHLEEVMSLPDKTGSPNNPYGQGFTVNKTDLKTAGEGRTNISPLKGRIWVFTNPNVGVGKSGQEKGWKLVPASGVPLLMKEDSPLRKKAGYASYNMWITPYSDDQIYPGGFYLNGSGLSEWVGNKPEDSIVNTDIVLFYTFTVTHFPRVEDWPVMPQESAGFWFKPYNFFSENPAIDVPPPSSRTRKVDGV